MGDARRRKLAGLPRFRAKPEPDSSPLRSPEEVEREIRFNDRQQAIIAASLAFLFETSEDALRERTRRILRSHFEEREK